jgi:hypothetical protein
MKLKSHIANHYTNFRSFSSKRKIIVIESDDWGAIRMPSKNVYNQLVKENIVSHNNPYARFDSIALDNDWDGLFHILSKHRDKNDKNPCFTLNFIASNPNFEKIEDTNFQEYHYEHFIKTCTGQKGSENYQNYLKEGIKNGFLYPQLHGREHVNVVRWLKALQDGNEKFLKSFQYGTYFVQPDTLNFNNKSIFAAFDYDQAKELNDHQKILTEAKELFEEYFGFSSKSIIFPNYIWSNEHARFTQKLGFEYIQGTKFQNISKQGFGYKRKFRFTGQQNEFNQINLVRNCFFEPSSSKKRNTVQSCLNEIDISFSHNAPAIISSHRLNYIGAIDETNRNKNLKLLDELLNKISQKWPEVEYFTSQQLGALISNK